jgi:heme oxygenase
MHTAAATQHRPLAFRLELRSATRTEHGSLDDHPAFTSLASGTLELAGYGRIMRLFHGLYAGLDAALDEACRRLLPEGSRYSYARRLPMLSSDLARLEVEAGVPAPPPAAPRTLAGLCGALYVVEGSVLGGAMLQRATAALLAGHGGGGDAYWRWCRDEGGARWASACDLIEATAATQRARDEMIATARQTFALFADWFAAWGDDAACAGRDGPAC